MKVLDSKTSKRAKGEIWFGIPTWDPADRGGERSVKFAYPIANGRWARTSPEVPEAVVWEMLLTLVHQGRLAEILGKKDQSDIKEVVRALEALT